MYKKIAVLFFGCLITTVLSQHIPAPSCICNKNNLQCFLSNFESLRSINEITFDRICNINLNTESSLELQNSSFQNFPSILLSRFGRISTLTIKNAEIQAIEYFQEGRSLIILDLSHNKIRKLQNNNFQHLHNIKKIDLSHNMIEMIDVDAFAINEASYVKNYIETAYDLSFNQIKIFKRDWFLKTQNRKGIKVNFSFNNISEIVCNETIEQDIIKYLDLSHNQILKSENFYDCMRKMINLETLDLSFNNLGTEPYLKLETFTELINLQELSLAGNDFSSIPLGLLSFKKKLIFLDLSFNKLHITGTSILSFTPLRNLKQLDLSFNTYENDFAYAVIRSIRSLTELGIAGTETTCRCLARLINLLREKNIFLLEPKNQVKNDTNIDGIYCTNVIGGCSFI